MKLNGNNKEHKHVASKGIPEVPVNDTPAKEKSTGGKKKKALRRALVTLGVIVVVVLGVIIGYSVWEAPPDVIGPTPTPQQSLGEPTAKPTTEPDTEPTAEPTVEPTEEPIDEFEGALVTDRDDGIYTFLLVGRDHASNSTDTIIVGKFDTNAHTIDMVNIPRDTLINIEWSATPKKINAVYAGYTNGGYSGIEGLRKHVKNVLGFEVDFYAVVNLKVVEDVIDEIGGVYFDVPIDMHYDDYDQSFHIHVDKGYQLLNGYEALGVFRFRYGGIVDGVQTEGYPGGDVQRIQTQQDLLKAVAKQLLSLGNIPNLGNIIQLCLDNVETTLDASNMAFFARQFLKCSMEDINFHEAPTAGFSMINGVSFVNLEPSGWLEVVNQWLNPYSQDVSLYNMNIISANYDGTYINSTTGVIAGGWESFYCQTCSMADGWKAHWHVPGACPPADTGEAEGSAGGEVSEGGGSTEDGGETVTEPPVEEGGEVSGGQPPAEGELEPAA